MNEAVFSGTAGVKARHSKVPEIIALFWVIKILSTGMGEVFSDFLVTTIKPPQLAIVMGFFGLVAALAIQCSLRRYVAWIYWLAVVMVSIFGTMLADVIHVVLGVPYLYSTAAFLLIAAGIFITWYGSEKSVSIHKINTPRRELFYWATVIITFALGTAAGDLSDSLGLGYFYSGLLFTALIAIPALAYRFLNMAEVPAFWFAYILTRPLGASFADWIGSSQSRGGLGWGKGPVSLVLTLMIAVLVAYLSVTKKDRQRG